MMVVVVVLMLMMTMYDVCCFVRRKEGTGRNYCT
jgi:hypothetical protein